MNNKVAKMVVVLTFTAILAGGVLALVYRVAAPLIEENRLRELKEAIFVVLPEAKDYETIEKDDLVIYKGVDENGKTVGFSFVADGPGFQGKIKMMVGLNIDLLRLKGMKVLEQVETPGLGNRIGEDDFQNQFKGLNFRPKIEYIKNKKPEKPNQIQTITGATISSKAVVETLNKEIKAIMEVLKGD
ncbi:MAG: RnfABCDGE type electron transport complex subunit G [Thermodesulfobacteriota bacterium]